MPVPEGGARGDWSVSLAALRCGALRVGLTEAEGNRDADCVDWIARQVNENRWKRRRHGQVLWCRCN